MSRRSSPVPMCAWRRLGPRPVSAQKSNTNLRTCSARSVHSMLRGTYWAIVVSSVGGCGIGARGADRAPHTFWGAGHVDVSHTEVPDRVEHRAVDGRWRGDHTDFADTPRAERVAGGHGGGE